MLDHLLESSQSDDSNKWSNIGFGEEICIIERKICTLSGALFISFHTVLFQAMIQDDYNWSTTTGGLMSYAEKQL